MLSGSLSKEAQATVDSIVREYAVPGKHNCDFIDFFSFIRKMIARIPSHHMAHDDSMTMNEWRHDVWRNNASDDIRGRLALDEAVHCLDPSRDGGGGAMLSTSTRARRTKGYVSTGCS